MKQAQKDIESYKTYVKTSAVGLEVGISVLVGCLLGYFFDKKFATSPYGLIFGVLIGCGAAGRRLYAFTKQFMADNKKTNGEDKEK